jgi:hypothetical protein
VLVVMNFPAVVSVVVRVTMFMLVSVRMPVLVFSFHDRVSFGESRKTLFNAPS